jgi:hypothetical protein
MKDKKSIYNDEEEEEIEIISISQKGKNISALKKY